MRIERVDDTTVKLFITYNDIEDRGFKKEDLWSNRKRGEEFFWTVIDEVNEEEDFIVEGPLWVQVHAFEKGVEVTISKSKNEDIMNMTEEEANEQLEYQVSELLAQTLEHDDALEDALKQGEAAASEQAAAFKNQRAMKVSRTAVVKFEDLDAVIDYAYHHNQNVDAFEDLLYMLDGTYYYAVHFDDEVSEDAINDFYSQLLEFAAPSDRAEVYLNDYAKIIMSHNVTAQVRRYFTNHAEKA